MVSEKEKTKEKTKPHHHCVLMQLHVFQRHYFMITTWSNKINTNPGSVVTKQLESGSWHCVVRTQGGRDLHRSKWLLFWMKSSVNWPQGESSVDSLYRSVCVLSLLCAAAVLYRCVPVFPYVSGKKKNRSSTTCWLKWVVSAGVYFYLPFRLWPHTGYQQLPTPIAEQNYLAPMWGSITICWQEMSVSCMQQMTAEHFTAEKRDESLSRSGQPPQTSSLLPPSSFLSLPPRWFSEDANPVSSIVGMWMTSPSEASSAYTTAGSPESFISVPAWNIPEHYHRVLCKCYYTICIANENPVLKPFIGRKQQLSKQLLISDNDYSPPQFNIRPTSTTKPPVWNLPGKRLQQQQEHFPNDHIVLHTDKFIHYTSKLNVPPSKHRENTVIPAEM